MNIETLAARAIQQAFDDFDADFEWLIDCNHELKNWCGLAVGIDNGERHRVRNGVKSDSADKLPVMALALRKWADGVIAN